MAKNTKTPKTHLFKYEAKNRQGRKVKGELSAASAALAKTAIRQQGLMPTRVSKRTELPFISGKRKIKPADVAIFTRQLSTMMRAGVPLVQSFDIVADGAENLGMKELVIQLKNDVEGGSTFADALRKHPQHFDDLFCSLIDAGEQSGTLETMLDRVATYKEKTEALKSKIKSAIKYPIAVLIVAAVVTTILLVKVVPTFEGMFSSFGAELPAPTRFVVMLSEKLRAHGLIILGVFIALLVLFVQAKRRSPAFSDKVDAGSLKLPIFGDITLKSTVARFARTLSTTFAAGVPLIDALDACAKATGNAVYREAIYKVRDDVATGVQMHFAMRNAGIFPSLAVQMTAIGEESGALDDMLGRVANHYETEVDDAVDGLTSLLEPIIMSFLGIVIGGLVIAMYLPIFQMGDVVG